jgi:ribonuclease HII
LTSRLVLPQLTVEQSLWRQGRRSIAGVDEVGMGPLAGPVVAAAVVFPTHASLDALPRGVRDSKTLTPKARARLEQEIRATVVGVGIGVVEVDEIDRINIYQAGLKAMRLALAQLPAAPDHVLIDGRSLPELPYAQTTFVKGDRDIYSIAAASIVAKEYRDRLMVALHERYPQYGFAKHMGYGTAAHREALRQCGPCPAHRRSFRLL